MTGVPEADLPATHHDQLPKDFQDRVKVLVQQVGSVEYGGYIGNAFDALQYKQAVWKAKTQGKEGFDQKCDDYPVDDAGRKKGIQRIFEAIVNLSGEQDRPSVCGNFLDCLAVRSVLSISPLEIELVANDLMVRLS